MLLLAAAGAGKDKKAASPYALLAGTVFQESGFSLPGAKVEVTPLRPLQGERKFKRLEAVSDARGEFAFRVPVDEMEYKLTVEAPGYEPQEKTASVAGGVRVDVFFSLQPVSKTEKKEKGAR